MSFGEVLLWVIQFGVLTFISGIALLWLLFLLYKKRYEIGGKDLAKITFFTFGSYVLLNLPTFWIADPFGVFLTRALAFFFAFFNARRLFIKTGMEKSDSIAITILWFTGMFFALITFHIML